MIKYLTNNEIAVQDFNDAMSLVLTLTNNDYVTMISSEENLYIINYVWSPTGANRNDVCFQSREIIEDIIFKAGEDNND